MVTSELHAPIHYLSDISIAGSVNYHRGNAYKSPYERTRTDFKETSKVRTTALSETTSSSPNISISKNVYALDRCQMSLVRTYTARTIFAVLVGHGPRVGLYTLRTKKWNFCKIKQMERVTFAVTYVFIVEVRGAVPCVTGCRIMNR